MTELKVCFVGLKGSGKTTVIESLIGDVITSAKFTTYTNNATQQTAFPKIECRIGDVEDTRSACYSTASPNNQDTLYIKFKSDDGYICFANEMPGISDDDEGHKICEMIKKEIVYYDIIYWCSDINTALTTDFENNIFGDMVDVLYLDTLKKNIKHKMVLLFTFCDTNLQEVKKMLDKKDVIIDEKKINHVNNYYRINDIHNRRFYMSTSDSHERIITYENECSKQLKDMVIRSRCNDPIEGYIVDVNNNNDNNNNNDDTTANDTCFSKITNIFMRRPKNYEKTKNEETKKEKLKTAKPKSVGLNVSFNITWVWGHNPLNNRLTCFAYHYTEYMNKVYSVSEETGELICNLDNVAVNINMIKEMLYLDNNYIEIYIMYTAFLCDYNETSSYLSHQCYYNGSIIDNCGDKFGEASKTHRTLLLLHQLSLGKRFNYSARNNPYLGMSSLQDEDANDLNIFAHVMHNKNPDWFDNGVSTKSVFSVYKYWYMFGKCKVYYRTYYKHYSKLMDCEPLRIKNKDGYIEINMSYKSFPYKSNREDVDMTNVCVPYHAWHDYCLRKNNQYVCSNHFLEDVENMYGNLYPRHNVNISALVMYVMKNENCSLFQRKYN